MFHPSFRSEHTLVRHASHSSVLHFLCQLSSLCYVSSCSTSLRRSIPHSSTLFYKHAYENLNHDSIPTSFIGLLCLHARRSQQGTSVLTHSARTASSTAATYTARQAEGRRPEAEQRAIPGGGKKLQVIQYSNKT